MNVLGFPVYIIMKFASSDSLISLPFYFILVWGDILNRVQGLILILPSRIIFGWIQGTIRGARD